MMVMINSQLIQCLMVGGNVTNRFLTSGKLWRGHVILKLMMSVMIDQKVMV